jgi:hypothetical protein
MREAVKKKWVEALRSGKYKQGKGVLRDDDSNFCCLGVLCDLHAKTTKKAGWDEANNYLTGIAYLPIAVAKWAGIPEDNISGNGRNCDVVLPNGDSLSDLNDEGKSFKQIALRIEKGL